MLTVFQIEFISTLIIIQKQIRRLRNLNQVVINGDKRSSIKKLYRKFCK